MTDTKSYLPLALCRNPLPVLAVCLFLVASIPAISISPADSLRQILLQTHVDSQKVNLLNDIGWELKVEDQKGANTALEEAAQLANSIDYKKGEAQAYNNLGVVATIHDNVDKALAAYEKALELRKQLGDKKGTASIYNNMGNLQEALGNYTEALIQLRSSLRIREELRDTIRIARTSYNIAVVYESMGDYSEALDYVLTHLLISEHLQDDYEIANANNLLGNIKLEDGRKKEAMQHYRKALELREQIGEDFELGISYFNMGNILDDLGENAYKDDEDYKAADTLFVESEKYYQKAMAIWRQSENQDGIAETHNNIGVLFKNWGSYYKEINEKEKANQYFEKALEQLEIAMSLHKAIDNRKGMMEVFNGLGDVKRRQKEYDLALEYAFRCQDLAEALNDRKYIESSLKDIARAYDKLDKHKKAYKYRKRYDEFRWERFTDQRAKQNARREALYGDDRKQQEIEKQENEIALRNAELRQAALWRNSLIGGALALCLLTLLLYNRYRIKNNAATELEQKNKLIEKERQRAEALLLNILPKKTAQQLKDNAQVIAEDHKSVTVLFTDFKNFTQITEKLDPKMLVSTLDHCFSAFDEILERHQVEKIKTIGDAYMCAGGLPQADEDAPVKVVRSAIEMLQFMESHNKEQRAKGLPAFETRFGIHTGPVVAGVVGSKKFAYDIWGDTVNLAARMESNGEPGKINISSTTYEQVRSYFDCVYRGKIDVKNKGEVDMYFVNHTKESKPTSKRSVDSEIIH